MQVEGNVSIRNASFFTNFAFLLLLSSGLGPLAFAVGEKCDVSVATGVEAQIAAEVDAAGAVGKRVRVFSREAGESKIVDVERMFFDTANNRPILHVRSASDGKMDLLVISSDVRIEVVPAREVGAKPKSGASAPAGVLKQQDQPAVKVDSDYKRQADGARQDDSAALRGGDSKQPKYSEEYYQKAREFPGHSRESTDAYMKERYNAEYFDSGGLQHVYKNDNVVVDADGNVQGFKALMINPPSNKGLEYYFAETFVDRQVEIAKDLAAEFADTKLQVVQVKATEAQRKMGVVEMTFIKGEPGMKMTLSELCKKQDCSFWAELKIIEDRMESIKYREDEMWYWYRKFQEAHPKKEHGIALRQGKNPRTVAYDIGRNKRDNVIVKAVDPKTNPNCSWFKGRCWNLYLVDY